MMKEFKLLKPKRLASGKLNYRKGQNSSVKGARTRQKRINFKKLKIHEIISKHQFEEDIIKEWDKVNGNRDLWTLTGKENNQDKVYVQYNGLNCTICILIQN